MNPTPKDRASFFPDDYMPLKEAGILRFTDGALTAIAREALSRKSGARGLRAIMENIMLDVMYDIPAQPNIKEVLISEEVVTNREQPIVLYQKAAETA